MQYCLSLTLNASTFLGQHMKLLENKGTDKGPSIKYVRKVFGIFDPLPPLVRVCTTREDPPLCGRPNFA